MWVSGWVHVCVLSDHIFEWVWPFPLPRPAHLQAKRGLTGIMNFTNPGAVSHNEVRGSWGGGGVLVLWGLGRGGVLVL